MELYIKPTKLLCQQTCNLPTPPFFPPFKSLQSLSQARGEDRVPRSSLAISCRTGATSVRTGAITKDRGDSHPAQAPLLFRFARSSFPSSCRVDLDHPVLGSSPILFGFAAGKVDIVILGVSVVSLLSMRPLAIRATVVVMTLPAAVTVALVACVTVTLTLLPRRLLLLLLSSFSPMYVPAHVYVSASAATITTTATAAGTSMTATCCYRSRSIPVVPPLPSVIGIATRHCHPARKRDAAALRLLRVPYTSNVNYDICIYEHS